MAHDFDEAVQYLDDVVAMRTKLREAEKLFRELQPLVPKCLGTMMKELADGIDATLHDAAIDWTIQQIEEAADA
jgi:hypothetical protein